ncbi:hypothetical protein A9404_02045 [Halothiobacillus diazotrophicus]|uniref:BLUF domain-containing protein n=1 Tax=Halothiobacillus diazotrophicus TaxID=1860122 RepID=A0A191ZEL7_9GAMM|nr:BLUF domain-containing protein [Halothiobacillus diazotrophicus]ANJ66321.1 hypothetical protein A9404_02045 [Halothiobacillus diazotrophicus]
MLVRLLYVSKVSGHVGHDDVRMILAASQRNNGARGVSGLLMFNSGHFLQWLEGERRAVSERFARILQDERHTDVVIVDFAEVEARQFTDWQMGYLGEGSLNRDLFYRFSATEVFNPYALSGASAVALMLAARERARLLKSA